MKFKIIIMCLNIFFPIMFFSCNNNQNPIKEVNENELIVISSYNVSDTFNHVKFERKIKSEILNVGSKEAYKTLDNISMDNSEELALLPYALIMANKYYYKFAFYDVFDCLLFTRTEGFDDIYNLDFLDNSTRALALEYLMKAYVRDDIRAVSLVEEYIKQEKYEFADTLLYKKEYLEMLESIK